MKGPDRLGFPVEMKRPLAILIAAAAALAVLVAWLINRYPGVLSGSSGKLDLVYSLLLLALVTATLVLHRRFKSQSRLKHLGVWLLLGVGLFLAYTFRHDAEYLGRRVIGEFNPSAGVIEDGAVTFPVSAGGHFVVEAVVDGTPLRFLVDTGASDVVLSPDDAIRLGFDIAALSFDKTYRTANGVVMGAPVTLRRIVVGPIVLDNVRASVNGAPMERSLLGMSFLGRLSGYSVSNDVLTLRP